MGIFRFKQFEVDDSLCAMKVGTDAVLLGAWTEIGDSGTILDVGAGCGIISLMLAQRTQEVRKQEKPVEITAVEIEKDAWSQCQENFKRSRFSARLKSVNDTFLNISDKYDLIVSNPPFFSGDLGAPDLSRYMARQGTDLNYFSLIEFAKAHLSNQGRLAFISDMRHEKDILFCAELTALKLVRKCYVHPWGGSEPKRILWEFGHKDCGKVIKFALNIRKTKSSQEFDENYIALTRDFYLNL